MFISVIMLVEEHVRLFCGPSLDHTKVILETELFTVLANLRQFDIGNIFLVMLKDKKQVLIK